MIEFSDLDKKEIQKKIKDIEFYNNLYSSIIELNNKEMGRLSKSLEK